MSVVIAVVTCFVLAACEGAATYVSHAVVQ